MLQLDSQTQTPEFDRLCFDSHSNIIFPIGIYANKQLNERVDFSSSLTPHSRSTNFLGSCCSIRCLAKRYGCFYSGGLCLNYSTEYNSSKLPCIYFIVHSYLTFPYFVDTKTPIYHLRSISERLWPLSLKRGYSSWAPTLPPSSGLSVFFLLT